MEIITYKHPSIHTCVHLCVYLCISLCLTKLPPKTKLCSALNTNIRTEVAFLSFFLLSFYPPSYAYMSASISDTCAPLSKCNWNISSLLFYLARGTNFEHLLQTLPWRKVTDYGFRKAPLRLDKKWQTLPYRTWI